jgi:hypothetical protein
MLSFAVLRGSPEPVMLRGFAPRSIHSSPAEHIGLISPLCGLNYDPRRLQGLYSEQSLEVIQDVQSITQTYLARWKCMTDSDPTAHAQVESLDAQIQETYACVLRRPSAHTDWIYESCRLAALIYCRSIAHSTPLTNPTTLMQTQMVGPDLTDTSLISALHAAIMHTDTRGCWGDLRGVFMWACLVGGAASWPSSRGHEAGHEAGSAPAQAWVRKCFALYAVRAAASVPFDHASTMIDVLRTMLLVRHWKEVGIAAQGTRV